MKLDFFENYVSENHSTFGNLHFENHHISYTKNSDKKSPKKPKIQISSIHDPSR